MAHDPHIVDVVRRMKGEGVRNSEIGMSVGLTEDQIRGLCHARGIRRSSDGRLDLVIGSRMLEAFHAEAHRRDETLNKFMRRLLLTIVTDNLFTAILDDEET